MPAAAGGKLHRLSNLCFCHGIFARKLHGNLEQMVLHGRYFGRCIIDETAVVAKVFDIGIDACQALYSAKGVNQVKVAIAVAVVCAVDEYIVPAFGEPDRVQRLYPGVVMLGEDGADQLSGRGGVLVQVHVVLGTVHDLGKNVTVVRAPGQVGYVAVFAEIGNVQPGGGIGLEII